MSPVCWPCWNLIWYRSIEFWSSSGLNFGPSLPTTITSPKKLIEIMWNGLFADERTKYMIVYWYSLRRMCPFAVVGNWNKLLDRIKKSVLPVKYHITLSNASIKSIQEWLCVCLGGCNAGLLNEIFEVQERCARIRLRLFRLELCRYFWNMWVGFPSITSVLKEDVHPVTSLRNLYDTRPRCCVIAFLFHLPIAIDCN